MLHISPVSQCIISGSFLISFWMAFRLWQSHPAASAGVFVSCKYTPHRHRSIMESPYGAICVVLYRPHRTVPWLSTCEAHTLPRKRGGGQGRRKWATQQSSIMCISMMKHFLCIRTTFARPPCRGNGKTDGWWGLGGPRGIPIGPDASPLALDGLEDSPLAQRNPQRSGGILNPLWNSQRPGGIVDGHNITPPPPCPSTPLSKHMSPSDRRFSGFF